jgi:hypothetical protein
MKRNKLFFLSLFIISIFSVFINYYNYKSYVLQSKILIDVKTNIPSLSLEEVQNTSFNFPNINVFSMPLIAYKAFYLVLYDKPEDALDLINKTDFSKINPYIKFQDYIRASVYLRLNEVDSAYKYSKIAYYNWPKYFDHYKLLNELAVIKRDTIEIVHAFDLIDSVFYDRSKYKENFISSLAKAKISYLVKYNNVRLITANELEGNWQRVLEYEGNKIIEFENGVIKFSKGYYTTSVDNFIFNVKESKLLLSPINNSNYIVSENNLFYSDTYKTLIIVPSQDSGPKQAMFFKKINE